MLHSPLSNCLLRPRSSHHRHRRSSSSPSLAFPSNLPRWEDDRVHAAEVHRKSSSSSSSAAAVDDHDRRRVSASTAVSPINDSNNNPITMISPSPADLHRPSFESPFPSPYSLNVPLEAGASYRCMATLASHASALCLHAGHVYSGLQSGDVAVLRQPKLPECGRFGIGSGAIKALTTATDGRIFTAHEDHKIRVWRRPDDGPGSSKYRLIRTLPTASDYLRNLILASSRAYVQIRRHHRRLWIQHVDTVSAIAASPDASVLYSVSWDRTLKVWSLRSMRCLQSVKAHDDAVNALVAGSENEHVYTASADGTIKAWRRLTHPYRLALAATLDAGPAGVNTLLATRPPAQHEGSHVVLYSGGSDCCIHVWERYTWRASDTRLAATLRGHRQPVLSLALSGPLLCSGSADKMIRVWRRSPFSGAYTCLAILEGHNGPVKSVAIAVNSLRSCFVYSASLDCTTKVWSVIFDKEDQYHDVHHDNITNDGDNESQSSTEEYETLYKHINTRSFHPAT